MKKCKACLESFENHFRFCPIDGSILEERRREGAREFNPTLISDRNLPQRLATEVAFLVERARLGWPNFKAHPIAVTELLLSQLWRSLRLTFSRPHAVSGLLAALALVLAVVVGIAILERHHKEVTAEDSDELVRTITIDLSQSPSSADKPGVGAGENGRVGFNKGSGEGSGPQPARSHGGGGGGMNDPLPASQGKPPVPSAIPAPIPTTYARLPQALPDAGLDLDPVLYKALPFPNYGDPRSKSVAPSNGPGEDGGIGTGKGQGIGEGENNGFGPGRKGNIGGGDNGPGCCGEGGSPGNNSIDIDRIYKIPEVTTRPRVLFKPEPQYTEEARRNQITGTVMLSVVFSRDGQVTNIRAVQTLCCGLTEKAIAAARQIRFAPATRDGRAVSTHMQLEYNFNLY